MLLEIGVLHRVGIDEAEPLAEHLDIIARAGEEQPAGPDIERLGIGLQFLRRIGLGLEADRVHEDVAADTVAEQFLYVREILRHPGADVAAIREHEIDQDDLVLHQIVIEAHGFPLVRPKLGIGEPVRTILAEG